MCKRIICFILSFILVVSFMGTHVMAGKTADEIIQQIIDTYAEALRGAREYLGNPNYKFAGDCGAYVARQLYVLGITTKVDGDHGRYMYDKYKDQSSSSGGYYIDAYPSDSYSLNSALNTITQNGTTDVTNILVGFEKGWGSDGAQYGHVCFIHAIIGGNVYFSESFDNYIGGPFHNEGEPIVCNIATFCSYYSAITLDGLIHFYKDEGYISQCDPFPSYCTLRITDSTCKIKSLPCSVNTDPSSTTVESPSVGDIYTAKKLYLNDKGNYWYQVDCKNGETGYLYAGDCSYVSSLFTDVTGSNIDIPSSLSHGAFYPVTGTVSTKYNNISNVSVYIYPGSATSGTPETGDQESVDTKSYNLNRLDANVKYNILSEGLHNYVCSATIYGYYATGPKTAFPEPYTVIVKQQTFTVGSVSKHYLDINGFLDGTNVNSISGYGTCDVYINGSRVADDVSDYYTQWPVGTTYEIKDIRACTGFVYEGVVSGSLSGTIGSSDVNVRLKFSTEQVPGALSLSRTYLYLSYGETAYIDVTVSGSLPSDWSVWFHVFNANSAEVTYCQWQTWNGMTIPLQFYGNADGSSSVRITLVDNTDDTVLDEAYVTVNVTRPKIDYGEFYAYICHWDTDKHVVNEYYTTPYGKELELTGTHSKYDTYYIWHFIPLGDGYYRIENEYDEKILTASPDDQTDLGGNILYLTNYYEYQDARQTWMLCPSNYGLTIVSLETGLAMSLYNEDTSDGNYIYLSYDYGEAHQRFYLDFLDYTGLIPIDAPTLYKYSDESFGAVEWEGSPLTSAWDSRYYHVTVENSEGVLLDYDTTRHAVSGSWKVGWYYVTVTAVNPYYSNSRFGATATSSTVFYIEPYLVSFDAAGGTAEYYEKYLYYGESFAYLPSAWREGYIFMGWYTEKTGGTRIEDSDDVPYDISFSTLYAHWMSYCEFYGHIYVDSVTPPTCTAQGYTTHTCSRCGSSYKDSYTAALGHSWNGGVVTQEPTLTATGIRTYTCTRCGAKKTETIPMLSQTNPFVDVPEGKWYYNAVIWAYYHDPQITGGTDDTHFAPNQTCTRAQVMTFLWKAYGAPEPASMENPFSDVEPGKYYEAPILWAYHHQPQITGGLNDTTFGVKKSCTRAQVVMFLWAAAGKPEPTTTENPFSDVKERDYFYKAVLWAVENGITGGTTPTTFSPKQTCTRAQVVTFLYKAVG